MYSSNSIQTTRVVKNTFRYRDGYPVVLTASPRRSSRFRQTSCFLHSNNKTFTTPFNRFHPHINVPMQTLAAAAFAVRASPKRSYTSTSTVFKRQVNEPSGSSSGKAISVKEPVPDVMVTFGNPPNHMTFLSHPGRSTTTENE